MNIGKDAFMFLFSGTDFGSKVTEALGVEGAGAVVQA